MKLKKILTSLLLCGVLVISFAACSDNENVSTDNQEGTEQEEVVKDFDLHEMVSTYKSLHATTENVTNFETDAAYSARQGGYTDGKYFYQAFVVIDNASGEVDNDVTVVKYDMEADTIVKESELLKLNHCNDITYNPKTNKLYIANATGRKNIVSIMNPETLEIEGEIDLGFEIFSISYNESRDKYVVGIAGGQTFQLLDAEFNLASDILDPTTRTLGYVTQGNSSDDDYIYFVLYRENVINVYDWDGNFVSWIKLDFPPNLEPENISVVGDDIYIGTNSEKGIFKVTTLVPEE